MATIEYAIELKAVADIVLCSHVDCTSLGHILSAEEAQLPAAWKGIAGPLQTSIATRYGQLSTQEQAPVIAAEHVLNQVEELTRQPRVQRALNEDRLRIHAWVHSEETGSLRVYDPSSGHFSEATLEA